MNSVLYRSSNTTTTTNNNNNNIITLNSRPNQQPNIENRRDSTMLNHAPPQGPTKMSLAAMKLLFFQTFVAAGCLR